MQERMDFKQMERSGYMIISVLIGSRNRASILKRCLKSVFLQGYTEIEILVLDDGSHNPIEYEQLIKSFGDPRIKLFHSSKPLGVSGSRNELIKRARGEILFIIDDDAFFEEKNALSLVLDVFRSHPEVGIIACRIENHGLKKEDYRVPFRRISLKRSPWRVNTSCYSSYFLGGAHAILRQVILDCGLYNSDLFFGEEELDLSYRAISYGWKIYYEAAILIHHVPRPSEVDNADCRGDELFHHVKNRIYLAYRYLPARYIPSYLGLWMFKYLVYAIKDRTLTKYISGVLKGIIWLSRIQREPLKSDSVKYLRDNFGRLWY